MKCCPDEPSFPFSLFNGSKSSCFPPNLCKRKGVSRDKLNPGNIQDIHEKARNIMPNWIDGVQLSGNKVINGNRSLYASWSLSHSQPTGFRFGGSYQTFINKNLVVS